MQRLVHIDSSKPALNLRAMALAVSVHVPIIALLFWSPSYSAEAALPDGITISIVKTRTPPGPVISAPKSETDIPKPTPKPKPPIPEPKPSIPEAIPSPQPDVAEQPPSEPSQQEQETLSIIQSEEIAQTPGEGAPGKIHIPSRWALKPPLETKRLEGLGFSGEQIECLTSLEDACKDLRKEIFADYQLTETELVWTANRPDTGLPSQFYGLSDSEIRAKLAIPTAGENGIYIPFTNIGIGGPLMDKMHGVNKTCKYVPAFAPVSSASSGSVSARRVCD